VPSGRKVCSVTADTTLVEVRLAAFGLLLGEDAVPNGSGSLCRCGQRVQEDNAANKNDKHRIARYAPPESGGQRAR
jgi:hypothetical protein